MQSDNEKKAFGMIRGNKLVILSKKMEIIDLEEGRDRIKDLNMLNKEFDSDAKTVDIYSNLDTVRKMLKIQANQDYALEYTKRKIMKSYKTEDAIKEYIKTFDDIEKIKNIFGKRIRDFCEIYWPEITNASNEGIINTLMRSSEKNDKRIIEIKKDTKIGGEFTDEEIVGFIATVNEFLSITEYEEKMKEEIEKLMNRSAKNFAAVATPIIGARLLNAAGSFFKLASMSASTIQVLGAEKAMFAHVKQGVKPPKYGFIFEHPLVQESKQRGTTARKLANKISIAVKKDVFSKDKEFIAEKLLKEIENEKE